MLGDYILMFDPYEKRVSRDIRNRLAEDFLEMLKEENLQAFEKKAAALKQTAPDDDHVNFIDRRTHSCIKIFQPGAADDPYKTARNLWESGLYYECHEWLEPLWIEAEGGFKKAVQGIIRAAGAHALYEAGRTAPASSSAKKAIDLITTHSAELPVPFDADQLIKSLGKLIN